MCVIRLFCFFDNTRIAWAALKTVNSQKDVLEMSTGNKVLLNLVLWEIHHLHVAFSNRLQPFDNLVLLTQGTVLKLVMEKKRRQA